MNIEWFDRLGSTNLAMRERFNEGAPLRSGDLIAAREQTDGRGRQTRRWISFPDRNLCFSLFIETDAELAAVPSLSMAAALAVNDLLRSMDIRSEPKWPNDVMVGHRKICGILSERVERRNADGTLQSGMILGVGLNVNMSTEELEQIDRPATSILNESGQAVELDAVLHRLSDPLNYWIEEWMKTGFPGLRERWTELAGPIGKRLKVHDGDDWKSGTLEGFGPHGELHLKTEQDMEIIWSGDVV